MKILPNQNHQKKYFPQFKANLEILPETITSKGLKDLFQVVTEEVKGTVKLIKNDRNFDLEYHDGEKVFSRRTALGDEILEENTLYSVKKPYLGPVMQIVANLYDMMAKKGVGYTKENPFTEIFNKITTTAYGLGKE